MSASLASEIAQLHELFKLGALTQEEFNEAKQATIRNFRAAGAPAPPAASSTDADLATSSIPVALPTAQSAAASLPEAPPPQASASPAAAAADSSTSGSLTATAPRARTLREWKRLWETAPVQPPVGVATTAALDATDVRVQALSCLGRLLRNVQAYPAEPKYRHIRESNKVIGQELLPVAEASTAVLTFAGFVREAEDTGTGSAGHVWVLRGDDTTALARKAANAVRLVEDLLAYYEEQQTRRYGLLQLWRSVALEVRLERATSSGLLDVSSSLDDNDDDADAEQDEEHALSEEGKASNANAAPWSLLQYLIECYTTDEAGDGLYSAALHLQTLTQLYESAGAAVDADGDAAAVGAVTTHSLLATAEVYGAVVQQRGAVELLLYGCGARLTPAPAAAAAAAIPATLVVACTAYTVELVPSDVKDRSAFIQRCLRLLRRLRRELTRVKEARTQAARQAAEASMRQEMRRERQRRQLELQRTRDDDGETGNGNSADSHAAARLAASPSLRPHQRRRTSSSSSSSSASSPSKAAPVAVGAAVVPGAASRQGGRRIPVAEALAVLMGKKSPPTRPRPPPAATSTPSSSSSPK